MPIDKNSNKTSNVYLPVHPKNELNNQSHYEYNYLQTYLINQQKQNKELSTILSTFQEYSIQSQDHQLNKINDIDYKLQQNDFLTKDLFHKLANLDEQTRFITKQLESMEKSSAEQKELVLEEAMRHTALFDQILYQDRDISFLTDKMNEFNQLAVEIKERLEHTDTVNEKIKEKLTLQEVFHETILENLEDTNGNVNRLTRQMEHIKEIIFERVHYLADKVEDNLKGITQPVQRFFIKTNKKD